jgi:4-hydroxybenzoyl-CoA thioesterase/acyl-CoA thioester hydrolase
MSEPFTVSRRVPFRETDAAGIMHFSAFFGLMEEAEHELLRHLDLPLFLPVPDGHISWPRVAASCDFQRPARFNDVLRIEVVVDHLGAKSVTYGFHFRREGQSIARGSITAVCCCLAGSGSVQSRRVPPEFAAKLTPHQVDAAAGR